MRENGDSLRLRLLQRYTLPIVHMRQQLYEGRLSLIFGSGIGWDLKFPVWPDLIEGISERLQKEGVEATAEYSSLTYRTQILFQKYRNKRLLEPDLIALKRQEDREATVRSEWRRHVHSVLYKNPKTRRRESLDLHP